MDNQREANYLPIVSTTVSLAWLSERLTMRHYKRVSQAEGKVKREPDRRQKRWRNQFAWVVAGAPLPRD